MSQQQKPYFAEGTPAMLALENMVDAVGIRNVLHALDHICGAKAVHLAEAWQDRATSRMWENWAKRCTTAANAPHLIDPMAR